jgi:DivIVA domain-containing protein
MRYRGKRASEEAMELSARTIQDHRFASSMRGYRTKDVDSFLAEAAAYVSNLEEQLAIARTRADKSEQELADMRNRIDAELAEARRARAAIIDEAKAEAATIVDAARSGDGTDAARAAAITQEADLKAQRRLADADGIIADARAVAERIVDEAEAAATQREAEADRVLDAAHAESKRLHAETEQYRAEMERNLAEIKRILQSTHAGTTPPSVDLGGDDQIVVDLREERNARAVKDA